MSDTLGYYDSNAEAFVEATLMSPWKRSVVSCIKMEHK